MSSTLTWLPSSNGAKTGTTTVAFINDLATLVNQTSANTAYTWQVASSLVTGTTYQIVFKRKDGRPGRILIWCYTVSPNAYNTTLFEAIPLTGGMFITYFPAGTLDQADTTALNSSTGTIMGMILAR